MRTRQITRDAVKGVKTSEDLAAIMAANPGAVLSANARFAVRHLLPKVKEAA